MQKTRSQKAKSQRSSSGDETGDEQFAGGIDLMDEDSDTLSQGRKRSMSQTGDGLVRQSVEVQRTKSNVMDFNELIDDRTLRGSSKNNHQSQHFGIN